MRKLMTMEQVLEHARSEHVKFLRLQFTDILGVIKNVEVPGDQFEKAMKGQLLFDGSSIEGFTRSEETDKALKPDPDTFRILPWSREGEPIARLICDIYNPDNTPFEGCPRLTLKRAIALARNMGYSLQAGPEIEFFLFLKKDNGDASTETHDSGSYFDMTPVDKGEEARRDIINVMESMDIGVEAAHHELAPGQHEIDLIQNDALTTADNIETFRFIVRFIAAKHGLHATFMPKPLFGRAGSGMHVHLSLFKDGRNAFYDPGGDYQLSKTALQFIGGLLRHARGFCVITNPLVNSYKRLVPGYDAPTNIVWSEQTPEPLIRVPAGRGAGTRVELRMPDPSCNPYLALTAILSAGLAGIKEEMDPGPSITKNVQKMSHRERRHYRIGGLPRDLQEACELFRKDDVIHEALGDQIFGHFLEAKRQEWSEYIAQVHPWELVRYLTTY
jgi:glutamine synthetase